MGRLTDSRYLKEDQYRSSEKLSARAQLHARFSQQPRPWHLWVFDQLDLQPGMRVLEVGCGPAWLWRENRARIPQDVQITLTDLSDGMVTEAQAHLADDPRFRFQAEDAQSLPFEAGSFDWVIANHMLYHIPDLPRATAELARVLKPGGRLCAATNGQQHMADLYRLLEEYRPGVATQERAALRFSLENAAGVLSPAFTNIRVLEQPSRLFVTEVQPLVDYIRSDWVLGELEPVLPDIRRRVQAEIDREGGFSIRTQAGVVLADKA